MMKIQSTFNRSHHLLLLAVLMAALTTASTAFSPNSAFVGRSQMHSKSTSTGSAISMAMERTYIMVSQLY